MAERRRPRRRAVRAALWGLAAFNLVEVVRLRQRRAHLRALPEPTDPPERADLDGLTLLAVEGAEPDAETLAGVAAEMRAHGLELIDLVPGDVPADRALALLRRVDPERLADPLYSPAGAHEVVALHPDLAARMGTGGDRSLDRQELVRRTIDAQRHALGRAAVRVAPRLREVPTGARDRWGELEQLAGGLRPFVNLAPAVVGVETAWLLALTAGALLAPGPGLAALAAWSAQPALVLGGRAGGDRSDPADPVIRPPGGLAAACLLRLPRAWAENLRMVVAGFRNAAEVQAERERRLVPVPPPAGELFEARRTTCPWCESPDIAGRVDVPDFFQHKPGTFHLDECRACGVVFQNPRLSLQGLDYYYDQFYDGAGDEAFHLVFGQTDEVYEKRMDAVARVAGPPRSWLDVGTGHGHFGVAIRRRWPDAVVDGLDMSDGVELAARRRWVDTGYRGLFPELAGGLPRSYDVVSMLHYLEHTRAPRQELTAAAKVLEPGGHLLVEVPDPEAPWARRLGRWWLPWFQPQHQQLVPCANLQAALDEAGFDVVSVERGPASMPAELSAAVFFVVQSLSRSPHMPWLPAPSLADRARRSAALVASVPFSAAAGLVEAVRDARIGPDDVGNAYRIVARRR